MSIVAQRFLWQVRSANGDRGRRTADQVLWRGVREVQEEDLGWDTFHLIKDLRETFSYGVHLNISMAQRKFLEHFSISEVYYEGVKDDKVDYCMQDTQLCNVDGVL